MHNLITQMQQIQLEAQDNLLTVQIHQAHQENTHQQLGFPFKVRDRVILSTKHRQRVYKSRDEPRIAKFMPQFDGPYPIVATNETHSTVTLALPEQSQAFPIFHTSEVRPFPKNNDMLFPTFALHPPNPVTVDGSQEFL